MTDSHAPSPSGSPFGYGRSGELGLELGRDLDWVQRLAFRLCLDHALAEDLRQEAAVAVLRHGDLDEVSPGQAGRRRWLAGVVRNKLRMTRRTDGRRQQREKMVAAVEAEPEVGDVVERAEMQQAVTDAVLRLREPYRTTLLQRYFDEWSPAEIAERTQTPIDTVKSRLKRGLAMLKGDLAEELGEPGSEATEGWFAALMPLAVMESKRLALLPAVGGAQGLSSVPTLTTGFLMMIAKVSLLPIALLSLLGLLFSNLASESADSPAEVLEPTVRPVTGDDSGRSQKVATADGDRRAAEASLSEPVAGSPSDVDDRTTDACELTGRVIDNRGRGLGGVRVALYRSEGELLSQVNTGVGGRFTMAAPAQTDPMLQLRVEGEWLHVPESFEFGGTSWDRRLPLVAGPRELGTIVLEPAAAVTGRVVDADGAPVAGAAVTDWGSGSAVSAADGSFRLERIPVWKDSLEVRKKGLPTADVDVDLVASSVLSGVEVQMAPMTLLRGQVVDHLGRPVAGAGIELASVDENEIGRAKSEMDGTFAVPFARLGSAYLRVDAKGFNLWDSEERDKEWSPNQGSVRVALTPQTQVAFCVIDSATKEPIERFGIRVDKGAGSQGMQLSPSAEPTPAVHPGGKVAMGGRVDYDSVLILAEGYAPYSEDVSGEPGDGGTLVQTAELKPIESLTPGSIRGRVIQRGAPLGGAFIEVEGGIAMGERMKKLAGRTGLVFVAATSDLPLIPTKPDGSFSMEGLDQPLYRLHVHSAGSASYELPIVKLESGADLDLGDVDCARGGTVRGRVILPPGVSPRGLMANVGRGLGSARAPLDDGGSFELANVPVGPRKITIETRDGDFEDGAEAEVTVNSGSVTDVLIDASGLGTARARLELVVDGKAAADGTVLFVDAEEPETVVGLAFCDAAGRLDTRLPAAGDVGVQLMTDGGTILRHPSAKLALSAGDDIEETLHFRLGEAQLTVAGGRPLPRDGALGIELFGRDGELYQSIGLDVEDGQVIDSDAATFSPAPGTRGGFVLSLHRALVGEWTVKVSFLALDFDFDPDSAVKPETPEMKPEVWVEGQKLTVPASRR